MERALAGDSIDIDPAQTARLRAIGAQKARCVTVGAATGALLSDDAAVVGEVEKGLVMPSTLKILEN